MNYNYNQEYEYYYCQYPHFTICIEETYFNNFTIKWAEDIVKIIEQRLLVGITYIINTSLFIANYGKYSIEEFLRHYKTFPLPNIWLKGDNIGIVEWIDDNYVVSCVFKGMMEEFDGIEISS